jgi:hypothetical protein
MFSMMSLNIRVQSAVLACVMAVSSTSFCSASAVSNATTSLAQGAVACISNNKALSIVVGLVVIAKVRLMTKARTEYTMENFEQDVKNIFTSYNIFDAEVRAAIMNFIDKYLVGVEFKLEDTTTRTKKEDGSVFTIKGKKLTQKPFGVMGLFDAYVLAQAKKITEYIPAIAGLYLLVNNPYGTFAHAAEKAGKSAGRPE